MVSIRLGAAGGGRPDLASAVRERTIRLGRDWGRADGNDYSVALALIDRLVEVHLGRDRVHSSHHGRVVAVHGRTASGSRA